jgi:RPA family protein
MSESTTQSREPARRAFAQEFNDAGHTFKESDDDRAPVYLLLPTGVKANRVFVVGTLTETEDLGDDSEYWQGRVVDPNGDTFFVYAGQYQQEAMGFLQTVEPPAYVAVVGKPRTYETSDGDVNVSIRPESITQVSEDIRDRWVVETAERTMERLQVFDEGGEYIDEARERYDPDLDEYREMTISALKSLNQAENDDGDQGGDG